MIRRPPKSPLFPYTTLVRSAPHAAAAPTASPVSDRRWGSARRSPSTSTGSPRRCSQTASSPTDHSTPSRSEEHTSELQSRQYLVCRLLLEKKKNYHSTDEII